MNTLKVTSSAGSGFDPGSQYREVNVTIRRTRESRWIVELKETWGSAQEGGREEEHGHEKVSGRGYSLFEAVSDARNRASIAGITRDYFEQALSSAETEAEEAEARPTTMNTLKVTSSAGSGFDPGSQYREVDVTIRRTREGRWIVEVKETWGSAQEGGREEEHGHEKVSGRGYSLFEAVSDARNRASIAGITRDYFEQALSSAETEAEEAEARPTR